MRVMIWGAGVYGNDYHKYLLEKTSDVFVKFIDNDPIIQQKENVISPTDIKNYEYDIIMVTNKDKAQRAKIVHQLETLSVDNKKIVCLWENPDLLLEIEKVRDLRYDEQNDRRVVWLSSFAEYVRTENIAGNVAEAGVYRGDFSFFINKYFSDRKLYLFDTFAGFSENDLEVERSFENEAFNKSSFNDNMVFDTKLKNIIEIIKKRMLHPEKCEFHKGYFPESAKDVDDTFCFVNLDMDLYAPMLAGLRFFYPRMVVGGGFCCMIIFSQLCLALKWLSRLMKKKSIPF